jgi:ATP-binding cassette subfamily C protein/ATP-binding cassette subfamily C protein EexD
MQGDEIGQSIRACRAHIFSAAAFSLGINLLYLALPLYMLQIYDRVLSSGSVPTLVMLTVVCVLSLATLAALDIVRARVLTRSGLRLDALLAGRVLSATVERASDVGGLERGHVIRDLDAFRQVVTGPGIHALFDLPWAPLYIGIIFMIHPLLGLLSFSGAVVLLLLACANELVTRRSLATANETAARSYATMESALRNAQVIQGLGMLGHLTRRWLVVRRLMLEQLLTASDRSAWITGAIKFFRLFMQALMLGAGAYLVIGQALTAGAMIAAAIILGRALQPIEQLVGVWRQLVVARGAVSRVRRLLQERLPAITRVSLPRPAGRVTVENVALVVAGLKRPVLQNINFTLEPGIALGVIGPAAAGKSTLARLIVGILRSTAGAVRLDGADVTTWNREELGRHIGYLPQDIELFSGTVAENISRFSDSSSESIVAAANMAGAHEMILGLPQGYETHIGEAGSQLSGGQRQRIALARAVFGKPILVVLDEPNSNLDGEGEAALGACLKRLRDCGSTVVIISHSVIVLNSVDKLLQLRMGVIEVFGAREEVIARARRQSPMMQARGVTARAEHG